MTDSLHEDKYPLFFSHIARFLEWEVFQTKVVEKIKKKFMFRNVFLKNRAVYETVWKIL